MSRNGFMALFLLLSACGRGLSGEYVSPDGSVSYRFEPGGRVHISYQGAKAESTYEIYDRKIRVETPRGRQFLILLDDGSLQGARGIKLVRKIN
jgi:hypothetical protein